MSEAPISLDEVLQRSFRYAMSLVHDRPSAEELVQEACARVARAKGPWRVPYMIKVIHNLFRDQLRLANRPATASLDDVDPPAAPTEMAAGFDDAMHRALGMLRAEERELLYLAAVESYSSAEIAELKGKPRSTISSGLHRAREKLRRVLSVNEGRIVS